ncbi:selenoprotein S [Lampris incognitus]|uniref:selenoprotein S n=1 Tax=Lampris incognitus TaxID=2546036 RepID=UPI0024B5B1C8|nr:selenoprotein S [Lampris incognitus]
MEDVEIVDVDDDGVPQMDKTPIKNQDLSFAFRAAGDLVGQYGWYLLLLTVAVYVLVQRLARRRARRRSVSPETAQDPASVVRRQEALEEARRKMQLEFDAKAALFREKQKQLEEEKRQQKIEMWDSMQEGRSYKGKLDQASEEASSSATVLKPDKKPFRNNGYNPLTGEGGGSCAWRPGRRGPSSGG